MFQFNDWRAVAKYAPVAESEIKNMLTKLIRLHRNPHIDCALKSIVSILFLCLLAPLRIEMQGQLPVTLQSFVVLFVAISFGAGIGILSVIAYLAIGAMGVPVFAGFTGGSEILAGPSAGFFFGFVMAVLVCGILAAKPNAHRPIALVLNWTLGHVIILLLGAIWLMQFNEQWWSMIVAALSGAALKTAFGFLISRLVYRALVSREEFYGKT